MIEQFIKCLYFRVNHLYGFRLGFTGNSTKIILQLTLNKMIRKIVKKYSIRGAEDYLTDKGFYKNCRSLVTEFNGQLKEQPNKLEELGFVAEYQIPTDDSLRPRFDAYNQTHGIGVELEKREQMNIRSHLLFTEIAYRKGLIKAAVFIVPDRGQKGNFNRTKNELSDETEIFTRYFSLSVPIQLFGYQET